MPNYLRWYAPGGTFFFTLVTCDRAPIFRDPCAVRLLGTSMRTVRSRFPFRTLAIVLLPDHLHCLWALPTGDRDFSTRWNQIKQGFSKPWWRQGGAEIDPRPSRRRRRERG